MEDAAIRFARAAREADVAIFYYSGHAMQFAGYNYLLPIDAKLADEADLRRMVRVDEVVADLQQAKSLRILVLDSCRDNPLADELKRSIGLTRSASMQRGLARIDSPQGMIVAYATQAGRTAADGAGRNSPYTEAFLRHIEAPDEIGTIFRRVTADVYEATRHRQIPELSLSLIGDFYLTGRPQPANTPSLSPPPARDPQTDAASQAWLTVKDTRALRCWRNSAGNMRAASMRGLRTHALRSLSGLRPWWTRRWQRHTRRSEISRALMKQSIPTAGAAKQQFVLRTDAISERCPKTPV